MQYVAAYYSFANKLFIHCKNVHKSKAVNNKFSDGFHPVVLIYKCKFLFNLKNKICFIH